MFEIAIELIYTFYVYCRDRFAHSVRILTLYRKVRVVKVTHVVNSVVSNLMSKGGASNNGD